MNTLVDTRPSRLHGLVPGLSNQDYHFGPGVSKSQLDDIAQSPATYIWRRYAPIDTDKVAALDMGTALHCLLLEPATFKERYIIAPEFNRRTNAGKDEEKAFLTSCAELGKTVISFEDDRKLKLMRESVLPILMPAGCWTKTGSVRGRSTGLTPRSEERRVG